MEDAKYLCFNLETTIDECEEDIHYLDFYLNVIHLKKGGKRGEFRFWIER